MTTRGWFDPKLSMGNVLTIVIMLSGIFGGWYQLKVQVELAQERMTTGILTAQSERQRLESRLARVEAERDDVRERMIRLEIISNRNADLLESIARRLNIEPQR